MIAIGQWFGMHMRNHFYNGYIKLYIILLSVSEFYKVELN